MKQALKIENEIFETEVLLEQVKRGDIVLPALTLESVKQRHGNLVAERMETGRVEAQRDAALAYGWEPWTPPKDIIIGAIDMPAKKTRWVRQSWRETVTEPAAWMMGGLCGLAAIGTAFSSWVGAVTLLSLGAVFLVLLHFMLPNQRGGGSIDKMFHDTFVSRPKGSFWNPQAGSYYIYAGAWPFWAWEKYEQEGHLFDQCYVASFEQELFRTAQVAPARPVGDPFLVGRIGKQFYLGAQWDLSDEIKHLVEQKRTKQA